MTRRGSLFLVTLVLWAVGALGVAQAGAAEASDARSGGACVLDASDQGTFQSTPTADPNVLLTTDVAYGWDRCLGRYRIEASELINLQTQAVTAGQFTLFARGGTLTGTYAGEVTFTSATTITYHVTGPITSGTGRFAGARGTLVFDGEGDLAAGTLSDHITGTVNLARHPREAFALTPANIAFGATTADCPELLVTFDLLGRDGTKVGTGASCVQRIRTECLEVVFVGCEQKVSTLLSLDLARGSLTFRATLDETWLSEAEIFEVASGHLERATGIYEGHRGRLSGGGVLAFTATGVASTIDWLVTLRPRW
jgi:hypothetical protein